ncbi:MAG: hypothetical protein NVS1B16_03690 [Pseudarthrobacter sp.]
MRDVTFRMPWPVFLLLGPYLAISGALLGWQLVALGIDWVMKRNQWRL